VKANSPLALAVVAAAAFLAAAASAQDTSAARLGAMQDTYDRELAKLEADRRATQLQWEDRYLAALSNRVVTLQQAGNLEGVLRARNAAEAFAANRDLRAAAEGGDPGAESTRKRCLEAVEAAEAQWAQGVARLTTQYDAALGKLQETLTRAGQIDDAVKVKSVREEAQKGKALAEARGVLAGAPKLTPAAAAAPPPPAVQTKKVKVFILMGQSYMLGMGTILGGEGSLENAAKVKKKYPYLLDEAANWAERKDVRYVRVMSGGGGGMEEFNNEWMTVKTCKTIGPEFGIAHIVGDAIDEPVMILKSCIGNRSLGWDLLPPGSERFTVGGVTYAGYKDTPDQWVEGQPKKAVNWYAGKQYDDDVAHAKTVLSHLNKYCPGATQYEVAGFFFWQGEKDCGNAVHASRYEQNLVRLIQQLRRDFDAPGAKFVLATLGEATKGSGGNGGMVLEAQLAVDGGSGKYPPFKGNVATVYSNPLSKGGSGNSHYNGNAETYMDVGEAMGKAMVGLLKNN
jgi:hypothetical protein